MLAVDFVMLVLGPDIDVGILVSADSDLLPALEAVVKGNGAAACEVVALMPKKPGENAQVLRIDGCSIKVHALYETDYQKVHDDTDYMRKRRRR